MPYKQRKRKNTSISSLIIAILIIVYGIFNSNIKESFGLNKSNSTSPTNNIIDNINSNLNIYFIDVGQADCILISNNQENMLIDAGNNEDGDKLVAYLKSLNITNFKYIFGTHPHEDHIGGLDNIINNFNISAIYLPDIITTTKTFEDVITAIENKNLKITIPKIGEKLNLGNAIIKIIYTGSDESDLNNSSIVLKLIYGDTTYLFTGDATEKVENKILNSDITANVLKIGHHGSQYSSSNKFLKAVNPKYAIISVGKNNSYNHPKDITLNKLKKLNITTYRTDQQGTIHITSDGKNINIETIKTDTNGG